MLETASLALCAGALVGSSPAPPSRQLEAVYLDGGSVRLEIAASPKAVTVGPWRLGARVLGPKPLDKRLNLYIVAPGTEYHLEGAEDFDHNAIINALPEAGKAREYDVYWALVLDPHLHADFRSEQELIVTAQAGFAPGDLFEFGDIPAAAFLRAYLKADALADLEKYKREDGTLPRVLLVPAGFAISAAAPAAPK